MIAVGVFLLAHNTAYAIREDKITYAIQGDRRLKNEDSWLDSDAGTKGPIIAE